MLLLQAKLLEVTVSVAMRQWAEVRSWWRACHLKCHSKSRTLMELGSWKRYWLQKMAYLCAVSGQYIRTKVNLDYFCIFNIINIIIVQALSRSDYCARRTKKIFACFCHIKSAWNTMEPLHCYVTGRARHVIVLACAVWRALPVTPIVGNQRNI